MLLLLQKKKNPISYNGFEICRLPILIERKMNLLSEKLFSRKGDGKANIHYIYIPGFLKTNLSISQKSWNFKVQLIIYNYLGKMFLILIGSHHKREIVLQQFPVHEVVLVVEKNVQFLPKNKNLISPTASVKKIVK